MFRSKGEIEVKDLGKMLSVPEFEGISIGIVHKGPLDVRRYSYRIQRSRFEEMARIVEMRKGLGADVAPVLYDEGVAYVTEEGASAFRSVAEDALREYVVTVSKLPTLGDKATLDESLDELIRWGIAELLMPHLLEVQGLSKSQTFPTQSPSESEG